MDIAKLLQQRTQVAAIEAEMAAAVQGIHEAGREGADNAGYAAAWAAVLLATDIVKTGLATNRVAAAGFAAIDGAISKANKYLSLCGVPQIATKADLMRSVDGNLQSAASFIADVQSARSFLAQHKVKAPRELGFILDLALGMGEDTILLLQAGQLQQQVTSNARAAAHQASRHLASVRKKLRAIDQELGLALERAGRIARTA